MNTYKIIFAKNEVVSCELINRLILAENHYYEHDNGRLIYALVKAENELDAKNRGCQIVKEVTEKIFGNDFVN